MMKISIAVPLEIMVNYNSVFMVSKFDDGSMKVSQINKSGLNIFLLCNGEYNIEEIIKIIKIKYRLSEDERLGIRTFINDYIEKGVLIYNDPKNPKPYTLTVRKNEKLIIPFLISFEVTNACQLKCKHCFNMSGREREKELSVEDFIGVAKQFRDMGSKILVITGGEPFLKKNIERLINYASDNFEYVNILSNCYSLPNNILKTLENTHNVCMQISIDGKEHTHDFIRGVEGAYKITIKNIKTLIKHGIAVKISFTMNDINNRELDDVVKTAKNLGCLEVAVGLTGNTGNAKNNNIKVNIAKEFRHKLEKANAKYSNKTFNVGISEGYAQAEKLFESNPHLNKCGGGYNSIHFLSDGNITMCPSVKKYKLGNIKEQKLPAILHNKNILKYLDIPSPVKAVCGSCEYFANCGNCIANMLEVDRGDCVIQQSFPI